MGYLGGEIFFLVECVGELERGPIDPFADLAGNRIFVKVGVLAETQVKVGLELEIVKLFLVLNLALAVGTRSISEAIELDLEPLPYSTNTFRKSILGAYDRLTLMSLTSLDSLPKCFFLE